jgi:hypothetical protein
MRTFLLLSALLSHFLLFAQSDTTNCPCCTPQHQQFDFWIGTWEVTDTSGTIVGYNSITKEQNNCLLKESWASAKGKFTGTSFNYYDLKTKTWNQLWIDNAGKQLKLQGSLEDGKMVLKSKPFTGKAGKEQQHQITWTPYEDGSVRQVWIVRNLSDGSESTLFNGLYEAK